MSCARCCQGLPTFSIFSLSGQVFNTVILFGYGPDEDGFLCSVETIAYDNVDNTVVTNTMDPHTGIVVTVQVPDPGSLAGSSVTTLTEQISETEAYSEAVGGLAPLPTPPTGTGGFLPSAKTATSGFGFAEQSNYQFVHQVPVSCYLNVTWDEVFTPADASPPTVTPMSYTYHGSGNPCFPSGYNPLDNTTWPRSSVYDTATPPTNGSTVGENFAWTIVRGQTATDTNTPAYGG